MPTTPTDLAAEHAPLVRNLVGAMVARNRFLDRDDLLSAGYLALVQAAHAYDPTTEVPFAGYAVARVRGALIDEFRAADHLPRSLRTRVKTVNAATHALTAALGREPTTAEVAATTNLTEAQVNRANTAAANPPLSIDNIDNGIAATIPATAPSPEDIVIADDFATRLTAAVNALPDRLRRVTIATYLEGRPLTEVAAAEGVTQSRISQLRTAATTRLRAALT